MQFLSTCNNWKCTKEMLLGAQIPHGDSSPSVSINVLVLDT